MNPEPPSSPLWWQSGVIYQIYPRSFQDSNGDGVGDLPGITSRLDYLSDTLGVDAIWISPFYPSPMADFGYDVSSYIDVAPIFGTLADFDELTAGAHERRLRVIIDFVPNHSSDRHPWFRESRSSRGSPRRDWYIWADARTDGSPPNNWLSLFGGPAWEWDERTGQYYLHSFLKEQPDLNWRNPLVKAAMFDALRFWLERGVDGFRIDVAHFILKDPELRDNPPNPGTDHNPYKDLGRYSSQLHVYDQGHPDVHSIYRELRFLLNSYSDIQPRMAVGEIHVFDYPEWATYYGADLDELHLPFNFGLVGVRWDAAEVRRIVDTVEGVVPSGAWPTYVLGNHDEHRIGSRIGPDRARVAHMLLLTLRGTPTIYQGDEIGMTDVDIDPADVQDPWERGEPGRGLGRDSERTPMQWNRTPNAGFCPENVRPWLPVSPLFPDANVESEMHDPGSTLSLARALLRLRRASRALQQGSYRPVDGVGTDLFVYVREHQGERFLMALNFSDDIQDVPLAKVEGATVRVSTHMDRTERVEEPSLRLRPNEGCVLQLP